MCESASGSNSLETQAIVNYLITRSLTVIANFELFDHLKLVLGVNGFFLSPNELLAHLAHFHFLGESLFSEVSETGGDVVSRPGGVLEESAAVGSVVLLVSVHAVLVPDLGDRPLIVEGLVSD